MYEELVKRLREEASGWCTNCCYKCGDNACGAPDDRKKDCDIASKLQAADAIKQLQGEQSMLKEIAQRLFEKVPKWIPVTEQLPGPGEIVLVYGKRGGIYTAEHNRNGRWPGSFWKLNSKSHHCEPTHWMPLPEPPEEADRIKIELIPIREGDISDVPEMEVDG